MNIIFDCREKDLINLFNVKERKYSSASLPLGDILIRNKENEDVLLFERKTLNDLLCSIQDGRYEEQSFRLHQSSLPNDRIYYIIEGNIETYKGRDNTKGLYSSSTIYSCIYSLSHIKGFRVLLSNSLSETAELVYKFATKLDSEKGENITKSYLDSVKIAKKSNLTPEMVNILMLAQIPGVSKQSAQLILDKYNTLDLLIISLRENEDCLSELSYKIANGKTRKLNKTCIANLKKYLLNI